MCAEELRFYDEKNIECGRIVTTDEPASLVDLSCPICFCILWQPRACATCQHSFCNGCIRAWSATGSSTCPLCRTFLNDQPASSVAQSRLARLSIRCRNSPLGCTDVLSYDVLERHEQFVCRYRSKTCRLCDEAVPVQYIGRHDRTCQPKLIQCPACHCWSRIECFDRHRVECSEQPLLFDEDLLERFNVFTQPILSPNSTHGMSGTDLVSESRDKDYLTRFCAVVRLMLTNWTMIYSILLNLFLCGIGKLIYVTTSAWLSLQSLSYKSRWQALVLTLVFSTVMNCSLDLLAQSMSNSLIIVAAVCSLIVWSCIDRELEIHRFHMQLGCKELSLITILIVFLFQFFLGTMRLYFQCVSILFRIVSLTSGVVFSPMLMN